MSVAFMSVAFVSFSPAPAPPEGSLSCKSPSCIFLVHVGPSQDGDLHLLGRRPPLVSHLLLVLG